MSRYDQRSRQPRRPWCVGVTGGIAMGKSTLVKRAKTRLLGWDHVDLDVLAKKTYQIPAVSNALCALEPAYASQPFPEVLRQFAARSPKNLHRLERIIHPQVRSLFERHCRLSRRQRRSGLLIEAPLLFETQYHRLCHTVVAISCSRANQRRRLPKARRAIASRLIANQMKNLARCRWADRVISNNGDRAIACKNLVGRLRRIETTRYERRRLGLKRG